MQLNQIADKKHVFVIRKREELEKLPKKQNTLFIRPARFEFSLELLGPDLKNRNSYEKKLSQIYSDCNCTWGAAVGIIFLIGYFSWIITDTSYKMHWSFISIGVLVLVLSVALGKTIGLVWDRIQIKEIMKDICRTQFQQ